MDDFIEQFNATLARMETDEEFAHEVLVKGKGNPITLGPRVKNADEWVDDMISGAEGRAGRWLKNSLAPKKDPKKAALAAKGKYESRMREALDNDHFGKGVNAYDEAAREEVIRTVGESGFKTGVRNHKAKAKAKIDKMRPMVAALATTIDAMPQDSDSDREARMLAARRGMIEIGKKMRGG